METKTTSKCRGINKLKRQQILFYLSFAGLPILQFIIFYVIVNFKSVLFAFQEYDVFTGVYSFEGFSNFEQFFSDLVNGGMLVTSIKNSLILYVFTFLLGTTLALVFSYYIYKNFVGAKAFRIILYLPHIISTVSIVTIYKYFADGCVPIIWEKITGEEIEGLLVNLDSQFWTILFLSVYLSFGNNVLIYTSNMSSISESIVESAELEGVTRLKEFIYITIPLIFPALINFVLSGIANIFANQMLLYNFYAANAEISLYTFGYYMYREVQQSIPASYPYLSAIGFVLTIILASLTFFIRHLLIKYGPSTD